MGEEISVLLDKLKRVTVSLNSVAIYAGRCQFDFL